MRLRAECGVLKLKEQNRDLCRGYEVVGSVSMFGIGLASLSRMTASGRKQPPSAAILDRLGLPIII